MSEHPEVFISYHTQSSSEAVRQISAALEGAGISCWYAPRNVQGDYASSIVRAINGCRVFLLILNEFADRSEDVRNEINMAFERVRRHEDISILPFRTDDKALSDAVLYYLGRMHMMDGGIPPEMLRIRELIDRISCLLGREVVRTYTERSAETGEQKQYRLVAAPVYPDNDFVGREVELVEIHRHLSGRKNKLFLVGMGGIGKSQVAMAYCDRYREEYDLVLWITFDTSLRKTVINDFSFTIDGLDRTNYPDDDDEAYFRRKLGILKRVADRRVLIVMDNFDVAEDSDLEEFCAGAYGVLFTSRTHGLSGKLPELEIGAMTAEEDQWALFRAEYKRNIQDEAGVRLLLDSLNGHPLTIRLVASAMQSNRRLSPEKMLESIGSGGDRAGAETVYSQLRQVFSLTALTDEELHLLKNLALMPLRGIGVETLYDWCGLDDFDVIDELIRKSWVVHNSATDEVHLHPLVADLMAEELEKDPECCDVYLRTVLQVCNTMKNYTRQHTLALCDCCEAAVRRCPDTNPLKTELLICAGSALMEIPKLEESLKLFQAALAQTTVNRDKPFLYHKISHVQVLAGNAWDSVQTALEGYDCLAGLDLNQMPPEVQYMKKVLLQRLGEAYRELGEYSLAEKYGREAVAVCDEFCFKDPELSRGWAIYHLADTLYRAGKTAEATNQLQEAVRLFESIHDDWSKAYCCKVLARILLSDGRYGDAMEQVMLAQQLHMHHYGKDTSSNAECLEIIGRILAAESQNDEAVRVWQQAVQIYHNCNAFRREQEIQDLLKAFS